MKNGLLVGLAARLCPEMYRVAVEASRDRLSHEVSQMALMMIVDELGKELQKQGLTEDEVLAVINRGADRASMAGDALILQLTEQEDVTPHDVLG